jgi:hypothetical protein
MSPTIPAYRLKIERAKRHIRELATDVQEFLSSDPYDLFIEDDAATRQRHWKVRVKECIPAHWSTIIGDIIHNARSALDLLMVAVVRHDDPTRASYNHVHFVIRESKEKFEEALPRNIQGASAQSRRIIEDLKPYKGGDEAFYRLHQLDILDKHKAIIPVGAANRSVGVTLPVMTGPGRELPPEFRDLKMPTIFLRPADRQFPLQDGATVFSAPHIPEFPFEDEIQVRIEIAFGEGQILEGEPIDPALAQIVQFVEGVCDIVERNILNV